MLMGGKKKTQIQQRETKVCVPPWWANPFFYLFFFLTPFFLVTVLEAGPYMDKLGQKINNLTVENVSLGLASIFALALGALPFSIKKPEMNPSLTLDITSINRSLLFLGTLSFACHLIYFAPVFLNPNLVLLFLSGNSSAMYMLRGEMAQIPGVTSFVSACLPFFSLYGFVSTDQDNKKKIYKTNRRLLFILFSFVAARSILGSERLALVEAIVCYSLPRVCFSWKPGKLRSLLPFVGIGGVFCLFSVGEYFRSWQAYKLRYDNFWDFITVRFFGYFATSVNNGAGVISHYEPIGWPSESVVGFFKLLNIFGIQGNSRDSLLDRYLNRYATPEFNNPCGLYIPYMDYGVIGGLLFILIFGFMTGLLYRKFATKRPLGLLLYPAWFVALLDLMRVWTFGESRFVPVVLTSFCALFMLRKAANN